MRKIDTFILEKLRMAMSVGDVLPEVVSAPNNMINCVHPQHPDDDTPSLKYYEEDNELHCFGCGWHADIFELVQVIHKIDTFPEAIEYVAESMGYQLKEITEEQKQHYAKLRSREELFARLTDLAEKKLWYRPAPNSVLEAITFLTEIKKIPEKTIQEAKLGYIIIKMMREKGIFSNEELGIIGLLRENKDRQVPLFSSDRITVPYLRNGRVRYMTFMQIGRNK